VLCKLCSNTVLLSSALRGRCCKLLSLWCSIWPGLPKPVGQLFLSLRVIMKLRLSLFKVRHLSDFFARGSSAIYLFSSNYTKRIDSNFKTHTQPLVFRRFFTMSKWVFALKHGYSNWIITLHETHTQPLVFRRFFTMSKWVFAFKHGYSNWIITFSLRCRPWITHRQLESLKCHRWVFEPRKELIARSVQFQNSLSRSYFVDFWRWLSKDWTVWSTGIRTELSPSAWDIDYEPSIVNWSV
jgi:hypothetical protein